jgi:dipeptidyl aminopeptidase/acylaminoacyl peptidase
VKTPSNFVSLRPQTGVWVVVAVSMVAASCAQATRTAADQPRPIASTSGPASAKPRAARPAPLFAISVDGTRIAYQIQGSGPPLVLIHGGGQTRRSWNERGYVDRLSKSFRVIALDLRGSGDSDRPATI